MMIRKNCMECGREFEPLKSSKGKYCSRECVHESQRQSVEIECENCDQLFSTKKWRIKEGRKYCSRQCAWESQNKYELQKGSYIKCAGCGENFYRVNSKIDRCDNNYCSHGCYSKDKKLYPNTLQIRYRVRKRNKYREKIKKLSDMYIKKLYGQTTGMYNVPQELIELKRLNIKRKRIIRNHNQKS